MESLRGLEAKLDEMFVKNAPFQMPAGFKKWVAEYAWILALIGAILGSLAFFGLLVVIGGASVVLTAAGAPQYMVFAWLALAVLGVQVFLYFLAVNPLKARQKRGWDLMFMAMLVSIVYGLFNWLQAGDWGANIFSFVWNLLWVVVGLYLLFQVRAGFTKKA